MSDMMHLSLAPEASAADVSAVSRLVARDFREARNQDDLQQRLAHKGFQIRLGYLATAPHGKLICPISHL